MAVAMLLILSQCRTESSPREKFHGMWKMDRHEMKDSASNKWLLDSTRIGLTGLVVYDGIGHMGVQQLKAANDSSENNIDITYFGTYEILANEVIQHTKLTSSFDDAGRSVRRAYEFRGDTLLLTPQEAQGRLRIRWIKVNSQ